MAFQFPPELRIEYEWPGRTDREIEKNVKSDGPRIIVAGAQRTQPKKGLRYSRIAYSRSPAPDVRGFGRHSRQGVWSWPILILTSARTRFLRWTWGTKRVGTAVGPAHVSLGSQKRAAPSW